MLFSCLSKRCPDHDAFDRTPSEQTVWLFTWCSLDAVATKPIHVNNGRSSIRLEKKIKLRKYFQLYHVKFNSFGFILSKIKLAASVFWNFEHKDSFTFDHEHCLRPTILWLKSQNLKLSHHCHHQLSCQVIYEWWIVEQLSGVIKTHKIYTFKKF